MMNLKVGTVGAPGRLAIYLYLNGKVRFILLGSVTCEDIEKFKLKIKNGVVK